MAFFWPLCDKALWSVRLIVVRCTDTPVSAVELCSSFRVTLDLCAASLIDALLARSVGFGGFAVVLCSFHLVMIYLMVLLGIIKDLDIFYNLTLSCTSQQHCPLLVWRVPWSSWQCLVSGASCVGVVASGAFQKRCVYMTAHVTLRLHISGQRHACVTSEGNWLH